MSERSFDDVSFDVPLPPERIVDGSIIDSGLSAPTTSLASKGSGDFWEDYYPHPDETGLYQRSAVAGLLGLGAFLMLLAVLIPLEFNLLDKVFSGRPRFWVQMLTMQMIMFPLITAAAFVIAVPMFWHISVFIRFLVAVALFVPAMFGMQVSAGLIFGFNSGDWIEMVFICSAAFSASAVIGVMMQMASPWSLTHHRENDEPLPRLGTRTLFELTAVIAILMALLSSLKVSGDLPIVAGIFAAVGAGATLSGILACIGFLKESHVESKWRIPIPVIISVAAALLASFCLVFAAAWAEFGWTSVIDQFLVTIPTTISGALVILGTMLICIWWLRKCGWRVVR